MRVAAKLVKNCGLAGPHTWIPVNRKSDGIEIFPKLPSTIKPFIKKWEAIQAIALLELQTKDSFGEIIGRFRADKVNLPPPKRTQTRRRQRSATRAAVSNLNESLDRIQPAHVPPPCAPGQDHYIRSCTAASQQPKQCAFWPICDEGVDKCGGTTESLCSVYGRNGSKPSPSQAELAYQVRVHMWSDKIKNQMCYWGCGKAVVCGRQD